ncbi:hypothetical protein GQ457_06G009580 [Hibiscus cannabinus]
MRRLRKHLWQYLIALSSLISSPWVVLGDFNATLSHADRQGCSSDSPEHSFQDMVSICGLHDLDYCAPHYTWTCGSRSVHLDRGFCNSRWFEHFLNSLLHHLIRMKSDHRPILLSTNNQVYSLRPHNFKYFAGWSLHRDFKKFVEENWLNSLSISEAIHHFSLVASKWNSDVFGSLGRNKKFLMARIRDVQRCLDRKRTANMVKLEAKLLRELDILLDQEEILWKQKSTG